MGRQRGLSRGLLARAQRIGRQLLVLARRGPKYGAGAEAELVGLGTNQLRAIIATLWSELAKTCAAQRNPRDEVGP